MSMVSLFYGTRCRLDNLFSDINVLQGINVATYRPMLRMVGFLMTTLMQIYLEIFQ